MSRDDRHTPSPPSRDGRARASAAEAAGEHATAGALYLEIGAVGAAVRCFLAAGDRSQALVALTRVGRDDAQYPRACALAIELALALDHLDLVFDQFAGPYLERTPTSDEETTAFYRAATLFERHGFLDTARDVLARLVAARPGFLDSEERLARVERRARGSGEDFARVVAEDEAFRSAARPSKAPAVEPGTFPELPELPKTPTGRRRPLTPDGRGASSGASRRDSPTVAAPRAAEDDGGRSSHAPPGGRVEALLQNVFQVPPGIVVAGRYQIEQLLGRGGMAAVYRARDLELEELVAVKLFARSHEDPTLLGRFKQELSLARQISHPNVIRLYDLGSHGTVRFITMELLSGRDLADCIPEGRDLIRDLGYLVQLCRGLSCVHERGVVHRDLKPENLFVTEDGVIKLMDFGIAKRRAVDEPSDGKGAAHLTRDGFTAGTPAYMAPEQINDFRSVTHLSDLYSIGVIAYQLFTGVLPFDHDNPVAVLMKHLNEQPAPPSVHDPAIPDELEFLILQLLEKEPGRRVQSCLELARDLEDLRVRLEAAPRRRG